MLQLKLAKQVAGLGPTGETRGQALGGGESSASKPSVVTIAALASRGGTAACLPRAWTKPLPRAPARRASAVS